MILLLLNKILDVNGDCNNLTSPTSSEPKDISLSSLLNTIKYCVITNKQDTQNHIFCSWHKNTLIPIFPTWTHYFKSIVMVIPWCQMICLFESLSHLLHSMQVLNNMESQSIFILLIDEVLLSLRQ